MEHKMIDRNSLKKQLRKAGLVVLEEQVCARDAGIGANIIGLDVLKEFAPVSKDFTPAYRNSPFLKEFAPS
eukprot:1176008-Prorocentrum_minimum.AAC.1